MEHSFSESELKSIQDLKTKAEQITSDTKYLDSMNFLRVLRAREFDTNASFEMWKKWYNWRVQYKADEITEEEMLPHIKTGEAFYNGVDKQNRPILILRFKYHFPGQFSLDSSMRYIIYLVEQGVRQADRLGSGQICVINDRRGITPRNKDEKLVDLVKKSSEMLQDFYAERLGGIYVLHVNWFYRILFNFAVRPFISRRTRDKIHILRNVSELSKVIDSDQLLVDYGGTNTYVHRYPEGGND